MTEAKPQSAIELLLEAIGCECDHHPDDRPEGVKPCLACRAEAEWRAMQRENEKMRLVLQKLRTSGVDMSVGLERAVADMKLALEAHEELLALLQQLKGIEAP